MASPDAKPPRRLGPLTGLVALALAGAVGSAGWVLGSATAPAPSAPSPSVVASPSPPPPALPPAPPLPERFETSTARLGPNQTLGQVLPKLGLTAADSGAVVMALAPLFPARKARAGDQLVVERRAGDRALHRFTLRQGFADEWQVARAADGTLTASRRPVELVKETVRVAVDVEGSVYDSLLRSHEDPTLAVLAADVLAWDVDFYRDVRGGDRMEVLVEKSTADGRFLRYGEVLAVAYRGAVSGKKRLFRWTAPDGQTSYFDDEGTSAQRGFLRTPLRYAHVTSGFGNRKHPMLGYQAAHLGVDYGAPTGTPVWAVGDGVVSQAGWNGGCGNSVTIRHRNGLQTLYCHLSQVLVSAGKGVSQKAVIGLVGSTGLSTGPHLHYAVLRGGGYINPAGLKVPRSEPVRAEWMSSFKDAIAPLRARLDGESLAMN